MNYIESSKSYTGSELETIFFRPMLTGASAQELGIRMLYNMPVPTTVHLWSGSSDILKSHTASGWDGSTKGAKVQKTIDMKRVKAEMGFSSADYYSLVFENLAAQAEVNLDDLTGTQLETVETELFRRSIAESIRATMWLGDTTRTSGGFKTFDGIIKKIDAAVTAGKITPLNYDEDDVDAASYSLTLFDALWSDAEDRLKDMKGEGQLAYFVTSDIYNLYEKALDSAGVDASYVDTINGRVGLMYHGIPVIDLRIGSYLSSLSEMESFALLTDRRNFVMAVNTADYPGTEIRMWYNPDEMENRQRAIFAAGCEILDEELISIAIYEESVAGA
ncbi:MAG: hypothetical protein R3Y68_00070 [Rikenellaceae bacterium]